MPNTNALWTLRESKARGMTSDLIAAFRARAAADGLDSLDALVKVMRQYIDAPAGPRQDTATAPQPPPER